MYLLFDSKSRITLIWYLIFYGIIYKLLETYLVYLGHLIVWHIWLFAAIYSGLQSTGIPNFRSLHAHLEIIAYNYLVLLVLQRYDLKE